MRYCKAALVSGVAGLLIACTPRTVVKTVEVPVTVFVPVPAELTAPFEVAAPKNNTVGECVRVAHARKVALKQCNARLFEIGGLSEQ